MDIIHHPSIILIIGRRRYGKSALGFYILEKLHTEQTLLCFVVGFPKQKQHLLPKWITPIENVEELPDNCIALVDEASFRHHAHKVRGKETEYMDKLISVSGQKRQTIIFVTHTMRKFAITLLLDVDLLLCKEPSLLHANLERAEVRKIMEEVKAEFKKLPREDVKKSTYVVSDGWKGFMNNPLPSFWSEELSEAWSGVDLSLSDAQTSSKMNEGEIKPIKIENGLKIWFKEEDETKVAEIFSKNSTITGILSGEVKIDNKMFYPFDLKLGGDRKYYIATKRFNIQNIIKEMEEQKISYCIDIESEYPLKKEDVNFENDVKLCPEKKEEKIKGYASKIL